MAMNGYNRSPFYGSNQTNSVQFKPLSTANNSYNCCHTSPSVLNNIPISGVTSGVMNGTTNAPNYMGFDEINKKFSQTSTHSQQLIDPNASQTSHAIRPMAYPTYGPTYIPTIAPMLSTSNCSSWCSSTSGSYVPTTYTFANHSLLTNTTNSQTIPNSCSALFMNSRISENQMKPTLDCIKGCDDSKEQLKVLIDYLESIRKSNEDFQSNLLNELKQLKEALIDLKSTTNELPLKLSDALTHSLASVQSRTNSISIDSDTELVEILDSIEISKSIEDEDEPNTTFSNNKRHSLELPEISTQNRENTNTNDIKSSTTDKFIFPYDSAIDLNKWLKKV